MDTTESSQKRQNSHVRSFPHCCYMFGLTHFKRKTLHLQDISKRNQRCLIPQTKADITFLGIHGINMCRKFIEIKNMIDMGTTTWDDGPSNRKEMTLLYTPYVQSFAILHAKSNPEDVDLLSESQKRTIISSLAGYCVQEEWDVLMGLLPDLLRETILEVFLETLIYKEIFGRFFRAPFWYLDGKMSPSDEGDKTFSARLQYLYDRFYESMYTASHPKI